MTTHDKVFHKTEKVHGRDVGHLSVGDRLFDRGRGREEDVGLDVVIGVGDLGRAADVGTIPVSPDQRWGMFPWGQ